MSDYCTAKDVVEQNIKRANEKRRKNEAMRKDYRESKRRNLYVVPLGVSGVRASEDHEFVRVAPGKFRKVYK